MRLWLTLAVLALMVPTASWATTATGGDCNVGKVTTGKWQTTACYNLCDGAIATDTACTEFDMDSVGLGDTVILEIEDVDAGCTGQPTATITTGPASGGSPAYDISTSTVTLDDSPARVVIDTQAGALDRYIFVALGAMTGCTDVDVRMILLDRTN